MDNQEIMATLDTRDTGQEQTKHSTEKPKRLATRTLPKTGGEHGDKLGSFFTSKIIANIT